MASCPEGLQGRAEHGALEAGAPLAVQVGYHWHTQLIQDHYDGAAIPGLRAAAL